MTDKMMFTNRGPRKYCYNCEKVATIEIRGCFYCSEHALAKVKASPEVPNMRLIQQ